MLRLDCCSARFGSHRVLEGIRLELEAGETASVIGPSGCGKSTLLALMAGLKEPAAGSVTLDGIPVRAGDGRVGLILQHYGLFPWLTAAGNVELGLRLRRVDPGRRKAHVRRHLEEIGLADAASRYPAQLSGGQKQRVAIARTLALEPRLLLMDEPFSALDELTRESLQDLLAGLLAERRIIAVLVTHSVEEAVYLGSTVLLLAGGPPAGICDRVDLDPGLRDRAGPQYFAACREVRRKLQGLRPAAPAVAANDAAPAAVAPPSRRRRGR
jgi:NitT/TauT family transport system ATP-binding protein